MFTVLHWFNIFPILQIKDFNLHIISITIAINFSVLNSTKAVTWTLAFGVLNFPTRQGPRLQFSVVLNPLVGLSNLTSTSSHPMLLLLSSDLSLRFSPTLNYDEPPICTLPFFLTKSLFQNPRETHSLTVQQRRNTCIVQHAL